MGNRRCPNPAPSAPGVEWVPAGYGDNRPPKCSAPMNNPTDCLTSSRLIRWVVKLYKDLRQVWQFPLARGSVMVKRKALSCSIRECTMPLVILSSVDSKFQICGRNVSELAKLPGTTELS